MSSMLMINFFSELVEVGQRSSVFLSLLVHPFGKRCSGYGDDEAGSCSHLTEKYKACGTGEMYNLRRKSCDRLCPQPLVWSDGTCISLPHRHISSVYNDASGCERVSAEEIHTLVSDVSEVVESDNSLMFVAINGTRYCVTCRWSIIEIPVNANGTVNHFGRIWKKPFLKITNGTVKICVSDKPEKQSKSYLCDKAKVTRDDFATFYNKSSILSYYSDSIVINSNGNMLCVPCRWILVGEELLSVTSNVMEFNGKSYTKPFYYEMNNDSVMVCDETDDFEESSFLETACLALEDATVSVATMITSVVCLSAMVVAYGVLSELRNVPGCIVLSQV